MRITEKLKNLNCKNAVLTSIPLEDGLSAVGILDGDEADWFTYEPTGRAYPGTGEMLENLKANGKKVYLLSNAQRIFTEYEMHDIDIFKYFDEIFISSDYGTKKPDIRFFDVLIKKCGIDPKKSLFIGNDSTTDIKGATEAGFDTFYVKSNISPENDMAENSTYKVAEFTKWEY